ncbi:MAG: SpoIVB peptidase, partial [Clostridia bacterium]|nr:SpoIVB peptidase [Clostridia bacterium]
ADDTFTEPYAVQTAACGGGFCETHTEVFRLGGIVPLKTVSVTTVSPRLLYPGGMLFGVRCATDGILVTGMDAVAGGVCPAKEAGLHIGDRIMAADDTPVATVGALSDAVSQAGREGRAVILTVCRGGEERTFSVMPLRGEDGAFRAGLWTRDCAAGIGTVTFIDPETCLFGGLGHGICDADTGELLPLARGTTLGVKITGIVRGNAGAPGELRGCFDGCRTGCVTDNTGAGVFGAFSALPDVASEALPMGLSSEVHEGDAEILCTLDDTGIGRYNIRIMKCSHEGGSRSFLLEVTDEALLAKTGGIIQGMSGSPVIQDGRLIGAVTHVLVNHPERGYGIYIENMISAMGMEQRDGKAA